MVLIEIIVQGLNQSLGQGSSQQTNKLTLKDGITLVQTRTQESADALAETILALLFSPNSWLKSLLKKTDEKLRGGVTFRIADEMFRLVKDFTSGSQSLSQFKSEDNQFHELSRDAKFIQQFLQTRCHFPTPSMFGNLFCIGGRRYRELLQNLAGKSEGGSDTGREYFGALEGASGDGTAAKQKRLLELQGQLRSLEQVQAMELKLDEMQQEIFEKEELLGKVKKKDEVVKERETQQITAAESMGSANIPDDVRQKIERFKKAEKDRTNDLHKLEGKAEKLVRAFEHRTLDPLQKNPLVVGGAIVFVLSAVALVTSHNFRIPGVVGLIIGIIVVAAGFTRHLISQEKQRKMQQQIDQLDYEKKAIEKRYEIEMSVVAHLMKRLQVREPDEIITLIQDRERAALGVKTAREDLEATKKSLNVEKAQSELQALQTQSDEMRRQMGRFSGANFDPQQLRRDVEQLEQELGASGGGVSVSSGRGGNQGLIDPLETMIQDACHLLKQQPAALLEKLKPGIETNLLTVSGRRLAEPIIQNGRITAISTGKGGKEVSIGDLNYQEFFFALFAVQFTLLQVIAKNVAKLPVVALTLPENINKDAVAVVLKALKHMSGFTQVVCITADKSWATLQPPAATI